MHGESKIKAQCELPLTGAQVVDTLITDLAVFQFEHGVMQLIELQEGATLEQVEVSLHAYSYDPLSQPLSLHQRLNPWRHPYL